MAYKTNLWTLSVFFAVLFLSASISVTALKLQETPFPQDVKPLSFASILLDTNNFQTKLSDPHTINPQSQFTSIHTLSTQSIALNSPTPLSRTELFPFGQFMQFSFKTQLSSDRVQSDDDDSEDLREFNLSADEYVVSPLGNKPTVSALGDDRIVYPKHTSFKGTRVNKLGQSEELYLTITPNSGDYAQESASIAKGDMESQSTQRPLSLDTLSGRAPNQFTVEGVFIDTQGDMYQVLPYSTLQYQTVQLYNELVQSQSDLMQDQSINSQAIEELSARMDTLSTLLQTMATQREDAAYDLSISKIDNKIGTCGNQDPEHAHAGDEVSEQSTLDMTPSFLSRWSPSCNPYIGRTLLYNMELYSSIGYQLWSSDTSNIASIVQTKVEARTKLFVQLVNRVYQQQLNVVFKIAKLVTATAASNEVWNNKSPGSSSSGCDIGNGQALTSLSSTRGVANTSTLSLALMTCKSTGVVGLAQTNTVCLSNPSLTTNPVAVSSFNGIYSWQTFAHEIFHTFGALHPFGNDSTQFKKYSGLMNYNYIRLGSSVEANDKYQFAFNEETDSSGCQGIKRSIDVLKNPLIDCGVEMATKADPIFDNSCGNGIIEPWEQCDPGKDTPCCTSCKLASGATCATEDTACCIDCQTPAETRCFLAGETDAKRGMCVRGNCTPLTCDDVNGYEAGLSCDDKFFFIQPNNCFYGCPVSAVQCQNAGITTRTYYEEGATCTTLAGAKGLCVINRDNFDPNGASSFAFATCVPFDNLVYVWKYTVVQQCTCNGTTPEDDVVDFYTCYDQSNFPVADSFCSGVTKPAPEECCCEPPCKQDENDYSYDVSIPGPNAASLAASIFAFLVVIVSTLLV